MSAATTTAPTAPATGAAFPYSAELVAELRAAARHSIRIPVDPQTGQRKGDPLPLILTTELAAIPATRNAVEVATGRPLQIEGGRPTMAKAAHMRAALRRWAFHDLTTPTTTETEPA